MHGITEEKTRRNFKASSLHFGKYILWSAFPTFWKERGISEAWRRNLVCGRPEICWDYLLPSDATTLSISKCNLNLSMQTIIRNTSIKNILLLTKTTLSDTKSFSAFNWNHKDHLFNLNNQEIVFFSPNYKSIIIFSLQNVRGRGAPIYSSRGLALCP